MTAAKDFVTATMPTVQRAKRRQIMLRGVVLIAIIVLVAIHQWQYAWMVLGVATFATLADIGLALVVGQVMLAAAQLAAKDTHMTSSQRTP